MKSSKVIETKYFGPTTHRDCKIRITDYRLKKKEWFEWNKDLCPHDNHKNAAETYMDASADAIAEGENGATLFIFINK